MNYLNKQVMSINDNYNYFFMKLFLNILKICIKVSVILLISVFINYIVIYIIVLLYVFYSIYNIINVYKYYINIINDIKYTLKYNKSVLEINFSLINFSFFKRMVKYGK